MAAGWEKVSRQRRPVMTRSGKFFPIETKMMFVSQLCARREGDPDDHDRALTEPSGC
jgi:hypothetical protein